MCIIAHYNKPTFEEEVWGDFFFFSFFCYRAYSPINVDLMIPYFGPVHAVFMSYIQQQSSYKAMTNSHPSYSFPSFPSLLFHLRRQPLLFALPLLGNIFNEQYWKLINIVFMVAKLGNICFGRKLCVRKAKMFLTPGKNTFCFRAAKFVSGNICFPRG